MIEKIQDVIRTLNLVEVHGKRNLDMLLGCIMTLESITSELQKQEVNKDG